MKKVEFLKIISETLKMMSKTDLRTDDYKYIAHYEYYLQQRALGVKAEAVIMEIALRLHTSESTVKRAFRRLSGEVTV